MYFHKSSSAVYTMTVWTDKSILRFEPRQHLRPEQ
jgi:hypothetical protein